MADLDDVSRCPVDSSCLSCRGTAGLIATTVSATVGVFCVTMCDVCIEEDELPNLSVVSAVLACLKHCEHLGITADQMSSIIDRRGDGGP